MERSKRTFSPSNHAQFSQFFAETLWALWMRWGSSREVGCSHGRQRQAPPPPTSTLRPSPADALVTQNVHRSDLPPLASPFANRAAAAAPPRRNPVRRSVRRRNDHLPASLRLRPQHERHAPGCPLPRGQGLVRGRGGRRGALASTRAAGSISGCGAAAAALRPLAAWLGEALLAPSSSHWQSLEADGWGRDRERRRNRADRGLTGTTASRRRVIRHPSAAKPSPIHAQDQGQTEEETPVEIGRETSANGRADWMPKGPTVGRCARDEARGRC